MNRKMTAMNARSARWDRLAALAAVALLAGLILGCRPAGPEPSEQPDFRGTWQAEDEATVFGRTLVTRIELVIGDSTVSLEAVTSEGTAAVHRLVGTGTYTLGAQSVTFTYPTVQQSQDLGDGTFAVDTLVDLSAEDLQDFASDFAGARSYTLTSTALTVDPESAAELVFSRVTAQ